MLALLLAVATIVFALVSELSRVSQLGLDQAILKDAGLVGAYQVQFSSESGVDLNLAYETVNALAADLPFAVWGVREVFPQIQAECPPYEQLGAVQPRILWDRPGMGKELPFGQGVDFETKWCVEGQEVPASSIFVPNADQSSVYGAALHVSAEYRELLYLSTLGPVDVAVIVTTANQEDMRGVLIDALQAAFTPRAELYGVEVEGMFSVSSLGTGAESVSAAADGIGVVYDIIRWGVLGLSAIALATVQALVVRQRSWFYGLLTAFGTSKIRVAALLSFDTLLIATAGLMGAGVCLTLLSEPFNQFAVSAFQVEMRIGAGSMIPALLAGIAISSAIAILIPLTIVSRRDPYAVLEAPRD